MELRTVFTSILLTAMLNITLMLTPANGKDSTEPLHGAAEVGDVNKVQQLLSEGADVNAIDRAGFTPLFYAAHKGYKDVAELLIAGGANVNAKDAYDNTPLHYAAMAGHYEVCNLLIAKRANVNAQNATGGTAMTMASKGGHSRIVELLRKHASNARPARQTASQGTDARARPELAEAAKTSAESMTEPDPIADPNAVRARIKTFKGLEEALAQVDARSRYEVREWLQQRADNRAELARAVDRQTRAEFTLIRTIAVEETAKKTTAVTDSIAACRQQRYNQLIKTLEEETKRIRPARGSRGSRGRSYGTRERYPADRRAREEVSRENTSPLLSEADTLKVSIKPVEGVEKQLEELAKKSESEMQQWLQGDGGSRSNLAKAVHEQVRAELILARKVAVEEAAKKTTAAIDGLLLDRQSRSEKLAKRIEKEAETPQQITEPPGRYRGRPRETREDVR